MNVFIGDDSSIVCRGLNTMLSEFPDVHIVGKAATAQDAITEVEVMNPDVVILDIRLRDGSGIEVLERIKKGTTSPIVIMLTNYPYPQYRKRCMDLGADYFFDKVTEIELVRDVFSDMLQTDDSDKNETL